MMGLLEIFRVMFGILPGSPRGSYKRRGMAGRPFGVSSLRRSWPESRSRRLSGPSEPLSTTFSTQAPAEYLLLRKLVGAAGWRPPGTGTARAIVAAARISHRNSKPSRWHHPGSSRWKSGNCSAKRPRPTQQFSASVFVQLRAPSRRRSTVLVVEQVVVDHELPAGPRRRRRVADEDFVCRLGRPRSMGFVR